MTNKHVVSGPPGYWVPAHLSYGQLLLDNFKAAGRKIALINGETGTTCTYRELIQQAVNLASGLRRLDVKKGDIIALCSENRTEYAVTVAAVALCGATIATVSSAYTAHEMKHVLRLIQPKYIFCSQKALDAHFDIFKSERREIVVIGDDPGRNGVRKFTELTAEYTSVEEFEPTEVKGAKDVVLILCSSGTTGLPKGVMLTHLNCILSTVDYCEEFKSPELKNVISFIPWHHAFGFISTMDFLNAGKTLVYLSRFQEDLFFRTIQNYKINLVLAVPTVLVVISKSPLLKKYDLTSVKQVLSGAAPLTADTVRAVKEKIPTISAITQGFGMTETFCVIKDETYDAAHAGSAGKPVRGVKAKIVDLETGKLLGPNEKGELCVKSPFIMKGYLGDASATEAVFDKDRFFKTGDIGYYTTEGIFYIVDRVKELIKYKGNQVPPAEVEAVLMEYGGVDECAVVGKPDEMAGELPAAFVVRSQGSRISEEQLKEWIASKLSNPKKLRGGVYFVEELPRNPSGKILRRVLKEKYFKKLTSKL